MVVDRHGQWADSRPFTSRPILLFTVHFVVVQSHSTHSCRLSSRRIFAVSYDQLAKSSDKLSTKTSRIFVLVSVIWSNFRHSFSFVNKD